MRHAMKVIIIIIIIIIIEMFNVKLQILPIISHLYTFLASSLYFILVCFYVVYCANFLTRH